MKTLGSLIIHCALLVTCLSFSSLSLAASEGVSSTFQLTKKQYNEFQKLQSSLSIQAEGKKCHLEYRNCWIDYEYKCHLDPNSPGGGTHCEQVPVRRCGKPEMICD